MLRRPLHITGLYTLTLVLSPHGSSGDFAVPERGWFWGGNMWDCTQNLTLWTRELFSADVSSQLQRLLYSVICSHLLLAVVFNACPSVRPLRRGFEYRHLWDANDVLATCVWLLSGDDGLLFVKLTCVYFSFCVCVKKKLSPICCQRRLVVWGENATGKGEKTAAHNHADRLINPIRLFRLH